MPKFTKYKQAVPSALSFTNLGKYKINPSASDKAKIRNALGTKSINRFLAQKRKMRKSSNRTTSSSYVGRENVARGSGIESRFVLNRPESLAVKVMKKTNPINEVFKQGSGFQGWDVGRQSVSYSQMFTTYDLSAMLVNMPARDTTLNGNRRFLLDKYTSELTFANGTNATAYVHIYDIMCKTDVDTADLTAGIGDPAVAWNNGEIQQGNPTGYHVIGSTPSRVDLFREHFKILNKTSHFLQVGQVHKHKISINYNRIMNEAKILNSIRFGGITIFTMLVCHGTPGQDDSAVPVVSTTAGQINWTQTQRYSYRYSSDNQANSYVVPALLPQPVALEVVQEDGDIDLVNNA